MFLCAHFKKRETVLQNIHIAFDELCANEKVHDRVLCFIGLPWNYLRSGVAQAVWMRGVNVGLPIYYDRGSWGCSDEYVLKNYLQTTLTKDGFRIKTTCPDKIWVSGGGQEYLMGKRHINLAKNGKPCDVSFVLSDSYASQDPLFVIWDYEKMKFELLN